MSFGSKEAIGEFLNRIYAVFGADVRVVDDANIVSIAKLIEEQGKA